MINNLSKVFIVKIAATILMWSVPLILFPKTLLAQLGFPEQTSYLFVRLLGWAYLALCIGYCFGLVSALEGKRSKGTIWVGLISNAGACCVLLFYGVSGSWSEWSVLMQSICWSSAVITGAITLGLFLYGLRGKDPISD